MGLLFALVALGLTVIFGVMDVVNFAHGEFLMIGMYTVYWTSLLLGVDPLIVLPASAIVGAAPLRFFQALCSRYQCALGYRGV